MKDKTARLLLRADTYRRALHLLLEDDQTMGLMRLSTLATRPSLYTLPQSQDVSIGHEEVERALENCLSDFAGAHSRLSLVHARLEGIEAQVRALTYVLHKSLRSFLYVFR